jgi:glutathione S-transferase
MITLYDYLPSQNAYKVRLLLNHLDRPYITKIVQIFAGEGRNPSFLAKNPTGAVPVLELEDGRLLSESNAILFDKGLASLRHWTMTGKLARRSPEMIAAKRALSHKTLDILERGLQGRSFLTDAGYSIADMSVSDRSPSFSKPSTPIR